MRIVPQTADLSFAMPDSSAGPGWRCVAPIVLFIFNRPETTRRVLDAIRRAKPSILYVAADGPRPDKPEDAAQCAAARALIDRVDWECAVHKHYAQENMGIKQRVESGLHWVFEEEGEAIVLEDDCVPDPAFFRFCEELLARYRLDERILSISGTDLLSHEDSPPFSYRFSRYPMTWGWATWRRAWRFYDPAMRAWPQALQSKWFEEYLGDTRAAQYWEYIFNSGFATRLDWDYAWTFSIWQHDGLSIHPNGNLVSNIGFGPDATHTFNFKDTKANRPFQAMKFPLRHPESIGRDTEGDRLLEADIYSGSLTRMLARVRRSQLQERAAQQAKDKG